MFFPIRHGEAWKEFRTRVQKPVLQPQTVKKYITPIEVVTGDFIKRYTTCLSIIGYYTMEDIVRLQNYNLSSDLFLQYPLFKKQDCIDLRLCLNQYISKSYLLSHNDVFGADKMVDLELREDRCKIFFSKTIVTILFICAIDILIIVSEPRRSCDIADESSIAESRRSKEKTGSCRPTSTMKYINGLLNVSIYLSFYL